MKNDIIFFFSDGEELLWVGSMAYLRDNPQAKDQVGVVFGIDGRPTGGPLTLQQTSPEDGWLVRQIAFLPMPLYAGSWDNADERGDNDTDFEKFQQAGFLGFEIENSGTGLGYHTTRDTVAALDPRLLQAQGDTHAAHGAALRAAGPEPGTPRP